MRPTTASSTSSAACSSTATATPPASGPTCWSRSPVGRRPHRSRVGPRGPGGAWRGLPLRRPPHPAGWRLTRVATTPVWVSHTPVEPFGPASVTANRSRGGRFVLGPRRCRPWSPSTPPRRRVHHHRWHPRQGRRRRLPGRDRVRHPGRSGRRRKGSWRRASRWSSAAARSCNRPRHWACTGSSSWIFDSGMRGTPDNDHPSRSGGPISTRRRSGWPPSSATRRPTCCWPTASTATTATPTTCRCTASGCRQQAGGHASGARGDDQPRRDQGLHRADGDLPEGASWDDVPDLDDPDLVFGMPDGVITARVDVRPWAEAESWPRCGPTVEWATSSPSWRCRSTCSARR